MEVDQKRVLELEVEGKPASKRQRQGRRQKAERQERRERREGKRGARWAIGRRIDYIHKVHLFRLRQGPHSCV